MRKFFFWPTLVMAIFITTLIVIAAMTSSDIDIRSPAINVTFARHEKV